MFGGGGVLAHAAAMPDLVKVAVLYYPATSWARNLAGVVGRIQVPVLVACRGARPLQQLLPHRAHARDGVGSQGKANSAGTGGLP